MSEAAICLVTGASGFIGGHLAARLRDEGLGVRAFVRASSDTSRLREAGIEIAVGDLTNPRSVAAALDGCDYAFHCGALVSDWATVKEIRSVNVGGTQNALRAAVRASVRRFVHFSTTDIYGYPGGSAVEETHTPGRFANWYAETKLAAEREVRRAEGAHGLEVVILRPATVYGPHSEDVVGDIAQAIEDGHMVLVDRGRAVAGLCYIENLLDAAILALRHEAAPGQAFNVTDGLDITWRRFTDDLAAGLGRPAVRWSLPYPLASAIGSSLEHGYRALRSLTGLTIPPLLSRQAVQVLGREQDFSNRKARELLGWRPQVGYEAGLAATVGWLRDEYLVRRRRQ